MNQRNEQTGEPGAEAPRTEQRILSMSPDGKSASSIAHTLRKRIEELSQAIRDKDVERLMTLYAPDVVVFDAQPPLETRGAGAYRQNFERWFGLWQALKGEFEAFIDFHAEPRVSSAEQRQTGV